MTQQINIGDRVYVEQVTEAAMRGSGDSDKWKPSTTTFRFNGTVESRQGGVLVIRCVQNKKNGLTLDSYARVEDVVKIESV